MKQSCNFSVGVDPASFKSSKRGLITGTVFVQVDDIAFPSFHWDDFPVRILTWWLDAVKLLLSSEQNQSKCWFMDGPYGYEIIKENSREWIIRLFDERDATIYHVEAVCNSVAVANAIRLAADIVMTTCSDNNWMSTDLDALASSYADLNALCI